MKKFLQDTVLLGLEPTPEIGQLSQYFVEGQSDWRSG
jgi:hypothetical protein